MNTVIELKHIGKSFGGKQIYRDVNLKVNAGACIGFAGRNGAGKSVLFQLMVGLLPPDSGEVRVNGELLGSGGEDFPRNICLWNSAAYCVVLDEFQGSGFVF